MGQPDNPTIATVLPVLNEAAYIGACLDSLIAQTYPSPNHLILVMDGGSTDSTRSLVQAAIERSAALKGPRIELHDNPGRFVAEARNQAMTLIPHDVTHVLELIGHSTVGVDHLQCLVDEWARISENESRPLAALGCRVASRTGELGTVESWIEATLASPLGSGGGQFDVFKKTEPCKIPAFVLHSRLALEAVGGWDETFISSQDSDLSMRLSAEGYALWRTPTTSVQMTKRTGLYRWWKMGHRYGFWRTKTVLKHPKRLSLREYLPWFGFLFTAGLIGLSFPLWWIPLGAYGSVLGIESIRMATRHHRPSMIIGVPVSLFILHVSFSVGLLDGLFRRGKAASDR
jgi:succinoglycan biosynthesis protein ExoA